MSFARGFGMTLTALGGIAAVVAALWFTHNGYCLWGLLAVAIMVEQVSADGGYALWAGFAGFVGGILVGVAVIITLNVNFLWALLLVAVLVEQIDGPSKKEEKEEDPAV